MPSCFFATTKQSSLVRGNLGAQFPVICLPLLKRIDVTKYPHLIDLYLADRSAIDQDSIDILIGSDY